MAEVSRTARVIQNAKVALFFYCINLILQFFSRKIFLDYLGAELLGLNTTAQNLLQFLNLAESGIGAAVAFALYKPLSQENRQEIIDIVSLQGWFYRWVGLFVIAGSIVLMAFFPWIFSKADVPLIYAYGTFIAFLISALLGYFVNYKIVVLSADQKEYQITLETQGIKVIKVFLQMLAIWKLPQGYVWWMVLEALSAIAISIRLNNRVTKEYPWLRVNISKGKILKSQYSYVIQKTRQILYHKISGYVLTQSTPLVIYLFTSLKVVALYGNYLIISGGCLMLVDLFLKSLYAGVGNLVAEGNQDNVKRVFWHLLTLRLFVSGGICFGIFNLSTDFVRLWIGVNYVLEDLPIFIMCCIYFIQMSRTCDFFLSAYGLFQDIWAPIAESFLNLSLSVLLGVLWGLPGILLGVLFSQIVIVNTWKPFFLFSKGFHENVREFIFKYTAKIILLLLTLGSTCYITRVLLTMNPEDFFEWALKAILTIFIYFFIGVSVFYLADSDFRKVMRKLTCYVVS